VSFVNDETAEIDAAIENAKARIAYGKHFTFRRFARTISILRKELMKEYGTLQRAVEALSDLDEENKLSLLQSYANSKRWNPFLHMALSYGTPLVLIALLRPKGFYLIFRAFMQIEESSADDPHAEKIITSYDECELFPPTLRELKSVFIARFGEDHWRGDFSVRDTLRFLKLPLRKDKRGRPVGAKSELKKLGMEQVRNKSPKRKN